MIVPEPLYCAFALVTTKPIVARAFEFNLSDTNLKLGVSGQNGRAALIFGIKTKTRASD